MVTRTYTKRHPRTVQDPSSTLRREPAFDQNDALVAVALLSAGAAVIHATVIQVHLREWWLYGTFFVVAATLQLIWTVLVLRRPSRSLLVAGAIGNATVVVLWLVTRVTGLPVGPEPWTPESIGLLDVAASIFEAVLVVTVVMMLRRGALPERTKVRLERPQLAVFTGAVAAITYLAVTGGGHH
jgi:hypothetical protein